LKNDNVETKNAFQKEIYDIIAGLGYEWDIQDGRLNIDLNSKTSKSRAFDEFMSSFMSPIMSTVARDKKTKEGTSKIVGQMITYSKGGVIKNIFASLFMALFFLSLSIHYLVVDYLTVALIMYIIATIIMGVSLLLSIRDIISTEKVFLKRTYGFKETKGEMSVELSRLTNMKKNDMIQAIFVSVVLIVITAMSYIHPIQPLVYFMSQFNPLVLFLVAFTFDLAYIGNKMHGSDSSKIRSSSILAIIGTLLFFFYLLNFYVNVSFLGTILLIFFDIMLLYSIPDLLEALIKLRRYSKWMNESDQYAPQIIEKG
jgi:hypothetical protein